MTVTGRLPKPVSGKQKKQKVLESFFCPPDASLTEVALVAMIVARGLELEPGGRR